MSDSEARGYGALLAFLLAFLSLVLMKETGAPVWAFVLLIWIWLT